LVLSKYYDLRIPLSHPLNKFLMREFPHDDYNGENGQSFRLQMMEQEPSQFLRPRRVRYTFDGAGDQQLFRHTAPIWVRWIVPAP
jgi:hypothetical protein